MLDTVGGTSTYSFIFGPAQRQDYEGDEGENHEVLVVGWLSDADSGPGFLRSQLHIVGASIEDPSALEVAYPAGVVSVVTTAVGLVIVFVGALLKAISSKER